MESTWGEDYYIAVYAKNSSWDYVAYVVVVEYAVGVAYVVVVEYVVGVAYVVCVQNCKS